MTEPRGIGRLASPTVDRFLPWGCCWGGKARKGIEKGRDVVIPLSATAWVDRPNTNDDNGDHSAVTFLVFTTTLDPAVSIRGAGVRLLVRVRRPKSKHSEKV